MKKTIALIAALVVIFSFGCAPSEEQIAEAIMQTVAAKPTEILVSEIETEIPPTATAKPTSTPKPTSTKKPTQTSTPTTSAEELEKILTEGIEALIMVLAEDNVSSINMIRLDENILKIELKTSWASLDRQPDVSYETIQLISTFSDLWNKAENGLLPILPDGFDTHLVTYSTDGNYRYESFTSFSTLQAVYGKEISYSEWVESAGAAFK
jgi:hypothetical protein